MYKYVINYKEKQENHDDDTQIVVTYRRETWLLAAVGAFGEGRGDSGHTDSWLG